MPEVPGPMSPHNRPPLPDWRLFPIVVASGFAGLGYEMVWTREFCVALGADMMAVLGSIAGFFGGLAIGAFALDGPLRRARSPRVAYAMLEAAIGLWGLASIWLLPAASRALPPLLGTHPAPGLLWAAGFAFPIVALLPATVAMGGTLTALERMVSLAHGDTRASAGIYAANTAGAVAGTLASAYWLFSALGLSGTLSLLAGLNALCAVAALAWDPAPTVVPGAAPPAPAAPRRRPNLRASATLLATGLLGIAVEVVVVRLAAQMLQNTLYTYAGLLAAYLLGTALGGFLWQRRAHRGASDDLDGLLAATALACLCTAALTPFVPDIAERTAAFGVAGELAVALALFLLPSAAMGALFGCLLQRTRDDRGSVGWAVGINSVGAATAPLVASQLLVPALGAWRALVVAALLYLPLMPVRRRALAWSVVPATLAAILLVLPAPSLIRVPAGGELLALREGPMATASAVTDRSGTRYLEVNGHFRMGGTSSMRSDYRQAVLPLLLHGSAHRALFLGVGTGATLVGGSRMPGVSVQGVELLPEVVELLPWFADPSSSTPPPPVTIADARRFVAADGGRYDVVVADLFHPALEGSGALYTTEHFAAVRQRLAPHGLFCQWLPLYQLDMPSLRAIVGSFLAVYPDASAWLNHFSVRTPMLALIGYADGRALDGNGIAASLAAGPVLAVTKPIGFEKPIDVLGQFVGGPRALKALAAEAPLNTDDRPFVALDARRNVKALSAPPADLLMGLIRAVRPEVADLPGTVGDAATGARLAAYWAARDRFLEAGSALRGDPRGMALVEAASPGLLDAIRLSAEFDPAYQPLLGMARSLLGSNREAGIGLLRAMVQAAPSRQEARDLLAAEFDRAQGENRIR
jgi:spermidine synthase